MKEMTKRTVALVKISGACHLSSPSSLLLLQQLSR